MLKFIKQNSLSIVLFLLFFVFLVGLSLSGFLHNNEELQLYGQPTINYAEYLFSSNFVEAVFENWESEFLQMGALVVLTIWLFQKGSADSKTLKSEKSQVLSRYSLVTNHFKNIKKVLRAYILYRPSIHLSLLRIYSLA